MFLNLLPKRVGHFRVFPIRDPQPRVSTYDSDLSQFLRPRYWERFKTNGIEELKDSRVGPDTKRQCEHGHCREAGVLEQLAKGESQVVHMDLNPFRNLTPALSIWVSQPMAVPYANEMPMKRLIYNLLALNK
jgi:hypothetical protein